MFGIDKLWISVGSKERSKVANGHLDTLLPSPLGTNIIFGRLSNYLRDELCDYFGPEDMKGFGCPSEALRVSIGKEICQSDNYRTCSLAFEALDRMKVGGEFTAMGM